MIQFCRSVGTWIHVQSQCLGHVPRRQEARPGGGAIELANIIVCSQGGQVSRPHSGHEQGAVVGLQARGGVKFMQRLSWSERLTLGVAPCLGGMGVGVWMGQPSVQAGGVRIHWVWGGPLRVGAAVCGGVVTVPEGRREVPATAQGGVVCGGRVGQETMPG